MGVCLHPKYGGWFAMRSVVIFKNLLVSDEQLPGKEPFNRLEGDLKAPTLICNASGIQRRLFCPISLHYNV